MTRFGNLRRALLFAAPAALATRFLSAQQPPEGVTPQPPPHDEDVRLPNGKKQRDVILKAEYEQNLKDAQSLSARARDFQQELEKSDQNVLSLDLLKQLDEIEKLAKRIRGRMRRI